MPTKPVILLAFANDNEHPLRLLRQLHNELRVVKRVIHQADFVLEVLPYAQLDDIFDAFQKYKDSICIFHFGGHADGHYLLLETDTKNELAHGKGLIELLKEYNQSLKLVFLNGCSTDQLAKDLVGVGIPAVIGTKTAIQDNIATRLAIRFYNALVQQIPLESAWKQAIAQIKSKNENVKDLAPNRGRVTKGKNAAEYFEWEIWYANEEMKHWKLQKIGNEQNNHQKLPQNMTELEEFKTSLKDIVEEGNYDEFFKQLSESNLAYDKAMLNRLKKEYEFGKYDFDFLNRLKSFANGIKK